MHFLVEILFLNTWYAFHLALSTRFIRSYLPLSLFKEKQNCILITSIIILEPEIYSWFSLISLRGVWNGIYKYCENVPCFNVNYIYLQNPLKYCIELLYKFRNWYLDHWKHEHKTSVLLVNRHLYTFTKFQELKNLAMIYCLA